MYVHIIFTLPPNYPPFLPKFRAAAVLGTIKISWAPLLCEKEISEFYLLTPTYVRVPRTSSTTSSLANTYNSFFPFPLPHLYHF